MEEELQSVLSDLLSLKASSSQLNSSLEKLRGVLTSIALQTGTAQQQAEDGSSKWTRAGFLAMQDSFMYNVVARLIDFLARCLLRLQYHKYGDDYQAIFVQLGQTMQLLQGFLLLHSSSRRLFSIQCNMELLVTCLTLPDHSSTPATTSDNHTPSSLSDSTATASPRLSSTHFDFTQSLFGHKSGNDTLPPTLAEITLETLLCALVDSPENVKLFESCNGIIEVSRLLRGKVDAGKAAKVKCLEFLYFWLYPETERQAAASKQPETTACGEAPRTPSTPRADRTRHRTSMSSSNELAVGMDIRVPSTPTDHRLRAMLESAHDTWMPTTPSKPSRTFEKTQLALSRSAAAAMSSPRKRPLHVSIGSAELLGGEDDDDDDGSPRAKRSSLSVSVSPARVIRRPALVSPGSRPRSILASSSARTSSISNTVTPPITPREEETNQKKPLLYIRPTPRTSSQAGEAFRIPSRPAISLSSNAPRSSPALSRSRNDRPLVSPALGRSNSAVPPVEARDVARRRLSRSLHSSALPSPHRPLTEVPGISGHTRGLFASTRQPSSDATAPPAQSQTERIGTESSSESQTAKKGDTYERRRQVLAQHVGNLDQLLHRFEVLRCR